MDNLIVIEGKDKYMFNNIEELVKTNNDLSNFDLIFVSGVFMYLNDEDCLNVMKCFNKLCSSSLQSWILSLSLLSTTQITPSVSSK